MPFNSQIVQRLLRVLGVKDVKPPENETDFLDNQWMDGVVGWYGRHTNIQRDRRSAYYDYEQIADFVLGSSALDMYTEDSFPYNHERNATIWVTSNTDKVCSNINDLNKKIDIETLIPAMAYTTALYGDEFSYLLLSSKGIEAIKQIFPYQLTRIEDMFGRLQGFTPGIIDYMPERDPLPQPLSRPWDIVHTRIPSAFMRHTGHGMSMLYPVRYIWRQLKIMLDGMVLYRWTRGADRMVYYVDTGNHPPEKQMQIVNKWRLNIKKRQHFNPGTQQFEQEWNPESIDEDIFWPLPNGSNSRVERLSGNANVGEIADIQLYVNLFFAGLRIPKAYMGFEGEIMAREVLPYQSIRYANVAYKLQKAVLSSIVRMYQIHNTILGYDPLEKNQDFTVHTSTISHLYDAAKAELLSVKIDIMQKLLEFGDTVALNKQSWLRYILKTYLNIDYAMIKELLPEVNDEDVYDEKITDKQKDVINKAFNSLDDKAREKLKFLKEAEPYFNPKVTASETSDQNTYEDIRNAISKEGDTSENLRQLIESEGQKSFEQQLKKNMAKVEKERKKRRKK